MRNSFFFSVLFLSLLFGSPVHGQDSPTKKPNNDTALADDCFDLKHGAMMRCIQKGLESLEKGMRTPAKSDDPAIWSAPEEYSQRLNPNDPTEANLLEGQKVFSFHCSSCHGNDGRGFGPTAEYFNKRVADLTHPRLKERTDGAIFWKITEGSWPMPAFWEGDTLSEQELWNLIHYLRSLSQPTEEKKKDNE